MSFRPNKQVYNLNENHEMLNQAQLELMKGIYQYEYIMNNPDDTGQFESEDSYNDQ